MAPDRHTGVLKIKSGKSTVPLPQTPEDLRLMHRRIGISWMMIAAKHSNRLWVLKTTVEDYRRLSDYILGKLVAGLACKDTGGVVLKVPSWSLVLSYDAEVRRKAYELVRDGNADTIAQGLAAACKDSTVMQIHFLTPLTLTSGGKVPHADADDPWKPTKRARKAAAKAAAAETAGRGPGAKGAANSSPKGKGKGAGGGKGAKGKAGRRRTNDKGQPICFKFNNGQSCQAGCTFAHECQICGANHPATQHEGGDTRAV
jgi:hypothetical protein